MSSRLCSPAEGGQNSQENFRASEQKLDGIRHKVGTCRPTQGAPVSKRIILDSKSRCFSPSTTSILHEGALPEPQYNTRSIAAVRALVWSESPFMFVKMLAWQKLASRQGGCFAAMTLLRNAFVQINVRPDEQPFF